ncbi:MAG: hypothetical protein HeimC2_34390 [Candidatus Heimdallarchaeota archaeon LC_2]|nr:MAG: hypothetical protein HeimC2_34390 [Candidatus Heimdallarchaeota archaeon LC_2]
MKEGAELKKNQSNSVKEVNSTDAGEELLHHSGTPDMVIKLMGGYELDLQKAIGIDYSKFKPLKKLRIKTNIPPSYSLMKFIIFSMKQKIQGLAIISRHFFSNKIYCKIHAYHKKAKKESDYAKLKTYERIQARLFWQNIKKYAQRRGVPFKRRLYHNLGRTQIDLLNHRLNIVGNRLRRRTLETIGKGKIFFKEIEPVHKTFSSLDAIEAIRPILYFIVIRSLSVPFSKIRELVDNIIELGIFWTNEWIASILSSQPRPRKLSYYNLCNFVGTDLREKGIFRFEPFTNRKVTGYYSLDKTDTLSDVGTVLLENQTKEQKAGERVHREILSQFPQPLVLPGFDRILAAYLPQIIAETLIKNKMDTYRGKPDLLIFGDFSYKGVEKKSTSNLMLIADIKTYDSTKIDLNKIGTKIAHIYQIKQYCKLLREHSYIVTNSLKAIIHIDRQNVPQSFIELIWIIINIGIEDKKDQELNKEDYEKYENSIIAKSGEETDYYDITIAEIGVKITFWM